MKIKENQTIHFFCLFQSSKQLKSPLRESDSLVAACSERDGEVKERKNVVSKMLFY